MSSVRVKTCVRNPVEKSDGTPQPFIGLEDVEGNTGRLSGEVLPLKAAEDSVVHQPGDVLFSKLRPYLAKSYLATTPGTGTGELLVLRPGNSINSRFLLYQTLSRPWLEWANTTSYGTKMPRTSWELLAEYRINLPSREEQRRIADFLDAETAHIDALNLAKERQVSLLQTRADTLLIGNLLPDSPSATHRETRLKYMFAGSRNGIWGEDPLGNASDVRCVRVADFDRKSLRSSPEPPTLRQVPHSVLRSRLLSPGDVLLEKSGGGDKSPVGFAVNYYAEHRSVCSNFVAFLRPREGVFPRFAGLLMAALYKSGRNIPYIKQTTGIQNLDSEGYLSQKVLLPSTGDQIRIAHDMDAALAMTGTAQQVLERQRRLLAERRQALITAAVTGQFDVSSASGRGVTEGVPSV